MLNEPDLGHPSDETLVAYIDGELDEARRLEIETLLASDETVAERVSGLMCDIPSLRGAFAPLLDEAPVSELSARVAGIPMRDAMRPPGRRQFFAVAAASVVAGIMIGTGFNVVSQRLRPKSADEWRSVVANYMMLYSPETLSNLPTNPAAEKSELARVADTLDLQVSPEAIDIPSIPFKRAQILRYGGQPLAQIAYLDPVDGPIALCFVKSPEGPSTPETEQRLGMNIVHWSTGTHAFLVIGRKGLPALRDIAERLSKTLPA